MHDDLNEENLNIICLVMFLVIGILVGYTIGVYRRWTDRNIGEALVRQSLVNYCKDEDAHVLNNVTLRLADGSTTQIDHILISTRGIFVIETKHFRGWIFGNPKSKRWTQVIYKIKHTFQNPLFQNYMHVKGVQSLFRFLHPHHIHNMVVFTGEATFKTAKIDNVCYIDELIPEIEKYSDDALSLRTVQFCIGRLEYMRLELTEKTDVEHQAYLAKKFGG